MYDKYILYKRPLIFCNFNFFNFIENVCNKIPADLEKYQKNVKGDV
ncbi:hypothetical protein MsAm2_07810 [Methanolapillus ohkumae]|uniref:Uncharacterized protein n=1 Tax=Methanolapillus ohkumae TaxID=3028298 RepID=A0AA96V6F8_9EURY|nr:hypothetical protein MsAm2_07810 [Methanosarcinaceae archaeon Am2]